MHLVQLSLMLSQYVEGHKNCEYTMILNCDIGLNCLIIDQGIICKGRCDLCTLIPLVLLVDPIFAQRLLEFLINF